MCCRGCQSWPLCPTTSDQTAVLERLSLEVRTWYYTQERPADVSDLARRMAKSVLDSEIDADIDLLRTATLRREPAMTGREGTVWFRV